LNFIADRVRPDPHLRHPQRWQARTNRVPFSSGARLVPVLCENRQKNLLKTASIIFISVVQRGRVQYHSVDNAVV
jgi:hypothetical protein